MLREEIKSSFKDASSKLTGFKKRAFMAQVTKDYIELALNELQVHPWRDLAAQAFDVSQNRDNCIANCFY